MRKINYKERGITLIALVITIIILLILAGVTISTALGQNGLFQRAKIAGEKYKESEADETEKLEEVEKEMDKISGETPPTEQKQLVTTVTGTDHETVQGEDKLGNPVVIPGGFKFVGDKDDTVEDGIIIQDDEGNEFVWIPVSNIDGNNDGKGTGLIKKEYGTSVEITLGRYTFATDDGENAGTPALIQNGSNQKEDILIEDMYIESINTVRTNGGASAKNLKAFIDSVQKNHGYYLARYEASYKSGSSTDDYKPYSKQSTSYNKDSWSKISGMLWNCITQGDASKVSKNMYNGDDNESIYVESDLVNSYAWDTAIVYIQAMKEENKNYANKKDGNGSLRNTGKTEDVKCNIYDMAGNVSEWTTEYSTYTNPGYYNSACVLRGGFYYNSNYFTASRVINGYDQQLRHLRFSSTFIFKVALNAEKR